MLNSITLIGRVGQDPTVKVISDTAQVSNFSVAYTEKYKDQPQTTWFNVQAWNGLSKIVQDQVHCCWVSKVHVLNRQSNLTSNS